MCKYIYIYIYTYSSDVRVYEDDIMAPSPPLQILDGTKGVPRYGGRK